MNWWTPSAPDQMQATPWLSVAATAYLGRLLRLDMHVLEHGSGGSTLWLAERVATVDSVESNPLWLNAVKDKATANVTLWCSIPDGQFDLLLIDGEPLEERADWLRNAHNLVVPGGVVVLDNANRPEYKNERIGLQACCESYRTIDGNEMETKYLVTEFYTLKGGRHGA